MYETQCAACRQAFTPKRTTARYCSARCRLVAHRCPDSAQEPNSGPYMRSLAFQAPSEHPIQATLSPPSFETLKSQQPPAPKSALRLHPGSRSTGIMVCSDETWPGMYRVHLPDGHVTDMVNLTRAKDAAATLSNLCGGQLKLIRWEAVKAD